MKKVKQIITIFFAAIAVSGIITSCKKDSSSTTGTPSISYVRVTNPLSSDSLLIGAHQGNLIAIIGDNLQNTTQIWFNDQQATLTPTYITKTSILVSVPNPIPKTVNNKVKLVFSNGDSLLYNFQVQISAPIVSSMVCEFVNSGDVATIRGNYFYDPLTVTFTGGVTGTIVSVKDNEIQVIVPTGAQPGQIIVKTNFGQAKSDFWFRDPRNHFIDSDPYEGWHDPSLVVTNPGPGDPPMISGNYIRVNKFIGAWSYNEIADGPASAMPNHSKNIPDAAILNPQNYYLKFEVNTLKPYNSSQIRINAGTNQQDNNAYIWKPPFDTRGQWQTVVIPYEEVVASYAVKPVVDPNGYWAMLLIQGPGDLDADISFDNFRIVPKISK